MQLQGPKVLRDSYYPDSENGPNFINPNRLESPLPIDVLDKLMLVAQATGVGPDWL
jgi:hypothetical protein